MKKTFVGIMALAISITAFVSCEQDAPEINFSQTTTVEMDFQEVIAAIQDQTLSITKRLDILNNAVKSQNTTLAEKLAAIETAIEEGVASIVAEQALIKKAIINTLIPNTDAIRHNLDALNKALLKLGVEEGIYPESNRDTLYMHPTTWDLLYKDEDLTKAFSSVMTLKQIPITVGNHNAADNFTVAGVVLDSKQTVQEGDKPILFALPVRTATANNPKPVEAVMYSYTKYVISAKLKDKDAETWEMTGQYQYSVNGGTYPYYSAGGSLNADTGFYEFKINLVREADHRQNITAVIWPMLRQKQQQ